MKKKQINSGISLLKIKRMKPTTRLLAWVALTLLMLLAATAVWSNVFAYEYYYFKCGGGPLEVRGAYYRASGDEGYGIHPGSDYSHCDGLPPGGAQRDPSTKAGAAQAKHRAEEADRLKRLANEYDIYLPKAYEISHVGTRFMGDRYETSFTVTTSSGRTFAVREMKHGSKMSYANLCIESSDRNWSGTIIGQDSYGRSICKVNPSKYVTSYIVGININKTDIMMQASGGPAQNLTDDVKAIFSSMTLAARQ